MFDRYVAGYKPSWKRRALLIASLIMHGLAGVALLVWSVLHVEEIAPPALSLTFFSAPPPPPPPPPPAGKKKTEIKPKVQQVIRQPTEIPKLIQPKEPEKEEDEGEEGGVEGGVKGGVAGGVVGGVVGGTLGGTGTKLEAAPKPKSVASFVLDAQRLSYPEPHLDPSFTGAHQKQTVIGTYKICIRQDGRVSDVTPITSIPGQDVIVIRQLKETWVYKPQPLPVCSTRIFKFIIN